MADFPALRRLEALPHQTHGYQGAKVEARGQQPMYELRLTATADEDDGEPEDSRGEKIEPGNSTVDNPGRAAVP